MQLPARLEATTLGDVLGQLARASVSGVLVLEVPGGCVYRTHLDRGRVWRVQVPTPARHLGDFVRDLTELDPRRSALLDRIGLSAGQTYVGQRWIAAGVVTPATVTAALERQLRHRLVELFSVRQAAVRFGVFERCVRDVGVPVIAVSEVIRGRPRARDNAANGVRGVLPVERASGALALLGLRRGATEQQIRRAFRRLAARLHPDAQYRSSAPHSVGGVTFEMLSSAYHQALSAC